MSTTVTKEVEFPKTLITEMFNKTKGHSALAKLANQTPIAFSGNTVMTFNVDGEVAIVGEGGAKPAGSAVVTPVTITPVKFVYQHRVSDEFLKASDEARLPVLQTFADGFAMKIARGLDIAAFHGVNPADGTEADSVSGKSFDKVVTQTVTYDAAKADENIDDAIAAIQAADGEVNGIAMAPTVGSALGKIKLEGTGYLYPQFRFGANPDNFGSMVSDINNTVTFGSSADRVIVGDFQNAFKWGYTADGIMVEVIEYGDPDGRGDLKRYNQVVLRSEVYVGWGILDASSFARVTAAAG